MIDYSPLENPIWNALNSAHKNLARTNGSAARYPSDVSPLCGLAQYTPAAFHDLAKLTNDQERVALFTTIQVEIPSDWTVVIARYIDQMVCESCPPPLPATLLPMSHADVPEMLALTALTKPGPFASNTIAMGNYVGIREGGKLVSMAGQRLNLDRFTEISAVCTDPAFRGRGYSKALLTSLARAVFAQNKTPFLHVKTENEDAKRVYEKLGFKFRRPIWFTLMTRTHAKP